MRVPTGILVGSAAPIRLIVASIRQISVPYALMQQTTTVHAPTAFPDLVRGARNAANLEQAQLAERLGMSQNYVSKVENGRKVRLTDLEMAQFCEALGGAGRSLVFDQLSDEDQQRVNRGRAELRLPAYS